MEKKKKSTAAVTPTLQQATTNSRLCRRPLDTYRQVWVSLLWGHCSFLLGPGEHKVLFKPSEHLWQVWGLILKVILPLLQSCWGFSFALEGGVFFLVGSNILLSMFVQQQVVILEFSQEKMST